LGERLLCKQEVVGSIPSGSTNLSQPQSFAANIAEMILAVVGGADFGPRSGAAESSFV
jgi:hypothetical protein